MIPIFRSPGSPAGREAGRLRLARALLRLLAVACLAPTAAGAQTLRIHVVDEVRGSPVAGTLLELRTPDGAAVADAVSDAAGRLVLTPPDSGEFVVAAERLGYEDFRSPLLALTSRGSVELEIALRPSPLGIEGLEVEAEVEAEDMLGVFGLTPRALGNRWIDRRDIEAIALPGGPDDVLRWQNIPGMWVDETDATTTGIQPLCVRIRGGGCALLIWNGAVINPVLAGQLNLEAVEAIAVLRPMEATTFYGTRGGNGAVIFWPRRGGSR